MDVAAVAKHQRRIDVVHWVRRMHGWFGLWGAVLGLLMGFSGIFLNHRNVLKLPMSAWLVTALRMDGPPDSSRIEGARPVPWADGSDKSAPVLTQPAHWTFKFGGPNETIQADYWQGNRSIGVDTTHNGIVATLTSMHKGSSMPLAWILLIDTLAGSLIFLSISGVTLWVLTTRRRALGMSIFGASLAAVAGIALSSF
jgi:hypothetical protein